METALKALPLLLDVSTLETCYIEFGDDDPRMWINAFVEVGAELRDQQNRFCKPAIK